jgi:hypothetical protein
VRDTEGSSRSLGCWKLPTEQFCDMHFPYLVRLYRCQVYVDLGISRPGSLMLTLPEIVTDFFSELKSSSSGFASFDYEEAGYVPSDLVKVNRVVSAVGSCPRRLLVRIKRTDALLLAQHDAQRQADRRARHDCPSYSRRLGRQDMDEKA